MLVINFGHPLTEGLDPFFVRARIWTRKEMGEILINKHLYEVSIPFSSGQGFGR